MKESLNSLQFQFTENVGELIRHAKNKGYDLTFGDTYAKTGHKENSLHYKRLAVDFNLFKDGKYSKMTLDHITLGFFWEKLHQLNRWGGRYGDGNHYEMCDFEWRTAADYNKGLISSTFSPEINNA